MLIGIPPFYHRNQELMFDLIKTSVVKFPSFIPLSENCLSFIKKVSYHIIFFCLIYKILKINQLLKFKKF